MLSDLDVRRRRASFRAAHRGTKEMDWLLGRFADARLADMGEEELAAFEDLIGEADPTLQQWIMDTSTIPDDRFAPQILALRTFHKLAPQVAGSRGR